MAANNISPLQSRVGTLIIKSEREAGSGGGRELEVQVRSGCGSPKIHKQLWVIVNTGVLSEEARFEVNHCLISHATPQSANSDALRSAGSPVGLRCTVLPADVASRVEERRLGDFPLRPSLLQHQG